MNDNVLYEGKLFTTNNCGNLVITKYINARKVCVKFEATGYETIIEMSQIKRVKLKIDYYQVFVVLEL